MLYGSTHGETQHIAEQIRQVVKGEGHQADLVWGGGLSNGLRVAD